MRPSVGVVIQTLVNPTAAGVMFTENPVTGADAGPDASGAPAFIFRQVGEVGAVALALGLAAWRDFDPYAGYQFVEQHRWIGTLNVTYHLGLDGLSLDKALQPFQPLWQEKLGSDLLTVYEARP